MSVKRRRRKRRRRKRRKKRRRKRRRRRWICRNKKVSIAYSTICSFHSIPQRLAAQVYVIAEQHHNPTVI